MERPGGIDIKLRFALDPVGEFLAALAYAEEYGSDGDKWKMILSPSEHAVGFQTVLRLTRQAYGPGRGWAVPTGADAASA